MTTVKVFAPAKINLTLHVTGQRDDGYHLLDSLVTFAPCCDTLVFQPGNTLSITVDGPEAAGVPADMNNLALKAAALVSQGQGAAITLTKNLPAASGIGGGSADAAAAFRGMLYFNVAQGAYKESNWGMPDVPPETQARALLDIGADIPMCLASTPARVQGIGEKISPFALPPLHALLVNPRVAVETPQVFKALASRQNAPMPDTLPGYPSAEQLMEWLINQRNDLEPPAIQVAPVIGDVLTALRATNGCQLARMSGSGATCFALYLDEDSAFEAGKEIEEVHPNWWIAGGTLGDQSALAAPRVS
jgi:4-diphosphocytidyl-2-C-methyl-D-erythritol kinase